MSAAEEQTLLLGRERDHLVREQADLSSRHAAVSAEAAGLREAVAGAQRAQATAAAQVREVLGDEPFEAREDADRFRRHNVATLEQLLPHLADEATRLSVAAAAREQLEAQFARDRAVRDGSKNGWVDDPAHREPAPSEGALETPDPPAG